MRKRKNVHTINALLFLSINQDIFYNLYSTFFVSLLPFFRWLCLFTVFVMREKKLYWFCDEFSLTFLFKDLKPYAESSTERCESVIVTSKTSCCCNHVMLCRKCATWQQVRKITQQNTWTSGPCFFSTSSPTIWTLISAYCGKKRFFSGCETYLSYCAADGDCQICVLGS